MAVVLPHLASRSAFAATVLLGVTLLMAGGARPSMGLAVRIAGLESCGEETIFVLDVQPGGWLKLRSEDLKREQLGRRLDEIFQTRVYRYVYVMGQSDVTFGEVAAEIDIASRHSDYVVLIPPSILKRAGHEGYVCLDPHLPASYWAHPPRD